MPPDVDQLINRVNSLTLDKNRLKQRLVQLGQNSNTLAINERPNVISRETSGSDLISFANQQNITTDSPNENKQNVIAGIKCSTSCEEDLIFMNDLYKRRLEEYDNNWDFIQSKCIALMSELNALQKRFAILGQEKRDVELSLKLKNDDYDKIQSELQTVVLNYETQISAMSEHMSMLVNRSL